MQYSITQNRWREKGRFSITDDSGTLRLQVSGGAVCKLRSPQGEELAAIKRHSLRRRSDVLRGGQIVATVLPAGFGIQEHYDISGAACEFIAVGDFFGHSYAVTAPGGSPVATVSQLRGFRENFDVETVGGEDDVLLLAIILAVEDLRDGKTGLGR